MSSTYPSTSNSYPKFPPADGGGGGGGAASDITLAPIVGVSGSNVQTGMQSLASEFTDSKISDDVITSFQAVYLEADGKVKRASASSLATANVFGISLQSGVVNANLVIQTDQEVNNPGWNWDVTKSIWLDTTLGGLTQTRPTTSGTQLCYLGMPTSPTSFILTPIGSRYLGQN